MKSVDMHIIEEHFSPDRLLRLVYTRDETGDTTIGFLGFAAHTHGSIIAALSGLPEEQAIRDYIERILTDGQIIAVSHIDGKVCDIWPTDDPKRDLRYKLPEETITFRRWSGADVSLG